MKKNIFLVIFNFLLFYSIKSFVLKENHTSTIPSSTLITKPNSYLYNPDDDDGNDEILLNRVKRDPQPFVCKTDGYYPDRQNCRIYHICTSGVDTAAVCGEGTAWDPVKKNCGWENTVQCKKGLRKWDEITDIRGGKNWNYFLKGFLFLKL